MKTRLQNCKVLFSTLFSLNSRGRSYLTLNSDLDPDHNYHSHIVFYVDACDYHDEGTFKQMIRASTGTQLSILPPNIQSIASDL